MTYFFQSLELGDGLHRSKDFFSKNLHVIVHVRENSGLDVEALGTETGSTY